MMINALATKHIEVVYAVPIIVDNDLQLPNRSANKTKCMKRKSSHLLSIFNLYENS